MDCEKPKEIHTMIDMSCDKCRNVLKYLLSKDSSEPIIIRQDGNYSWQYHIAFEEGEKEV